MYEKAEENKDNNSRHNMKQKGMMIHKERKKIE